MSIKFTLLYIISALINLSNSQSSFRDRGDYSNSPMPKFIINLDLPLRERYQNILPQFAPVVKEMIMIMKKSLKVRTVAFLGKLLMYKQPKEFVEEYKVNSELLNVPLSDLTINAVTYELFAGCTSIIICNKNKEILFGRNLDYDTAYYLHRLTYQASVYRNGVHLYDAGFLAGYVGVHVAYNSKHQIAVSLNQRSNKSILNNVYRFWRGYSTPIYVIKQLMDRQLNYTETMNYLKNVQISSNCYFIVAGFSEGSGYVMSKDIELSKTKVDNLNVEKGKWFLVQTNYDRDIEDPLDDYRRIPVEQLINSIGNNIDEISFFDKILSKFPSNNNITATTSVIKSNYFNSTLWTSGYDDMDNNSRLNVFFK